MCVDRVVLMPHCRLRLETTLDLVDIEAKKLQFDRFALFWGRGERYLKMETGVPHRIWMRVS